MTAGKPPVSGKGASSSSWIGSVSENSALEGGADLSHDRVRGVVDVGCSEPKEAEACAEQTVLATVVLDETVAMTAAVVLEADPLLRVVQVWPPEKAPPVVVERDLGSRKPGQHQEHAQARFHLRLGRGVGEIGYLPSPSNPGAP